MCWSAYLGFSSKIGVHLTLIRHLILYEYQNQFFYLSIIATLKRYRNTGFRPVYGLFFLWLHFACDSHQVDVMALEDKSLDAVADPESFAQFSQTFPQLTYPFHLAFQEQSFGYKQCDTISDAMIQKFLAFEPWGQKLNGSSNALYKLGTLAQSDSTVILLYIVNDSIGNWETENVVMSHVHHSGALIDRFILGRVCQNRSFSTAWKHCIASDGAFSAGRLWYNHVPKVDQW